MVIPPAVRSFLESRAICPDTIKYYCSSFRPHMTRCIERFVKFFLVDEKKARLEYHKIYAVVMEVKSKTNADILDFVGDPGTDDEEFAGLDMIDNDIRIKFSMIVTNPLEEPLLPTVTVQSHNDAPLFVSDTGDVFRWERYPRLFNARKVEGSSAYFAQLKRAHELGSVKDLVPLIERMAAEDLEAVRPFDDPPKFEESMSNAPNVFEEVRGVIEKIMEDDPILKNHPAVLYALKGIEEAKVLLDKYNTY